MTWLHKFHPNRSLNFNYYSVCDSALSTHWSSAGGHEGRRRDAKLPQGKELTLTVQQLSHLSHRSPSSSSHPDFLLALLTLAACKIHFFSSLPLFSFAVLSLAFPSFSNPLISWLKKTRLSLGKERVYSPYSNPETHLDRVSTAIAKHTANKDW